jgi:hypothetical protein
VAPNFPTRQSILDSEKDVKENAGQFRVDLKLVFGTNCNLAGSNREIARVKIKGGLVVLSERRAWQAADIGGVGERPCRQWIRGNSEAKNSGPSRVVLAIIGGRDSSGPLASKGGT